MPAPQNPASTGAQSVGNADMFQLLYRVVASDGSMITAKAMTVNQGCVVHTATIIVNQDGSRSVSESLAFVPNVRIETDSAGGKKLVPEK